MKNLTLKQLRYFDALAKTEHFGRAAELCSISQPALSMQIKELETMIGAPLIERTARQVRLTNLGKVFLERSQQVLTNVEDMANLVRTNTGELNGTFKMGIIPTVAPYILPDIFHALSERLPDLEIVPRESITPTLVEDLLQSRLDFIVAALPISQPSLREFALFDEEFVLVRSAEDASRPIPSPDKLQAMKLLLLEEGHCFRDQAISYCKMRPTDTSLVMEGSSLSTLVQMVKVGLGVTLIPQMAVSLEISDPDLSITRFTKNKPKRTIGMVWRKTSPLSQQLMDLGAIIRQVGQKKVRQ